MHPQLKPRSRDAGFVLVEIVAAAAVVGVLAALALVWASESRRQSSLGDNFANLKQYAAGTVAFGADNADLMWGFSWRAGVDYGFGGVAATDQQAAANQAWDILRRRTGRPEWFGVVPPSQWVPHILYSHLVLLDYLGTRLPAGFTASPEDHARSLWQADPYEGFLSLSGTQRPPGADSSAKRWPFSSSYELPAAFFSQDARRLSPAGTTMSQDTGNSHYQWIVGTLPLGGRRLSEVAFPAQKVMLHEQHQRHFGPRRLYFMHSEARVPLLMADGSASVRRSGDANRGFTPNSPTSQTFTRVSYQPQSWEPPTSVVGQSSELLIAGYRFTRSGLRGRDFGGAEVPWVD